MHKKVRRRESEYFMSFSSCFDVFLAVEFSSRSVLHFFISIAMSSISGLKRLGRNRKASHDDILEEQSLLKPAR